MVFEVACLRKAFVNNVLFIILIGVIIKSFISTTTIFNIGMAVQRKLTKIEENTQHLGPLWDAD